MSPIINIFIVIVVVAVCDTGAAQRSRYIPKYNKYSNPDFCFSGLALSNKYYDCWRDEQFSHSYKLDQEGEFVTPKMLEDYARHMCTVVKPQALKCLKDKISNCPNKEKIYRIADESGGTCRKNELNPAFKQMILDRLSPVARDSPCLKSVDLDREKHKCNVADQYLPPGVHKENLNEFKKSSDKIFNYKWKCHVNIYKDLCDNWQIPMLFSLQYAALTLLFGMSLKPQQVAMLQLSKDSSAMIPQNIPVPDLTDDVSCEQSQEKTFILMRIIRDRKEANMTGDIVVEMGKGGSGLELSSGHEAMEAMKFVKEAFNSKGGINMKLIRQKAKEVKEKYREEKAIEQFLDNINRQNDSS